MDVESMFYISEKDWYKLQGWAQLSYDKDKNEISGLMTAIPQKDGRFEISDVEILKQENSGSNTELDADSVSAYMMKYGMKYNNPKMKFVWWHSHHTMGAFWSGTDLKEIDEWKNNSFSLALVINLKEEYVFRVSIWKANDIPLEQHIDTTLTIERKQPKIVITETMLKNYKELCSNSVITHYGGYNRAHQGNIWPRQYGLQSRTNQNEDLLKIETMFGQALEKAESIQDEFVAGTIDLKEWNQEVKSMNQACKDKKLPFRVINFKLGKLQLIDKLTTTMPYELFEWDDNELKEKAETMAWNASFGGYNVY